ncbi:DUF397 domain-containing protein [Microbispora bryophytorum]|uniref:DUF397 domain-containing protein n=1 Tax=Microbispora bryophytorum TaxID=1460882 RepID=UPI003406356E
MRQGPQSGSGVYRLSLSKRHARHTRSPLLHTAWRFLRKCSRSTNDCACVEVAVSPGGAVNVRDRKNQEGPSCYWIQPTRPARTPPRVQAIRAEIDTLFRRAPPGHRNGAAPPQSRRPPVRSPSPARSRAAPPRVRLPPAGRRRRPAK